jgi:predicted AAA+ superfamily ATPase
MEIYTLWPLSQGELKGWQESFIDTVFGKEKAPQVDAIKMPELIQAIVTGGYPDIQSRTTERLRQNWYTSYINSILERDIRELSNIEGLTELPNLLSLIASRACGLMNLSDASRSLELNYMTLKRYLTLLQAVYIVVQLPAWANNLGKRLVKASKLYINDTGLLCHLIGRDATALESNKSLLGAVFENFVVMELVKQAAWSVLRPKLYHYRTSDNRYEVDLVLEARDGRVVGIECKASSTVTKDSFKGLHALKEDAGSKFVRGIVLYTGSNTLSFDDKMEALPVSALWQITNKPSPPLHVFEDMPIG